MQQSSCNSCSSNCPCFCYVGGVVGAPLFHWWVQMVRMEDGLTGASFVLALNAL